ncbi:hypothetical protein HN954_02245 [bacterium]|jgi:hypothetical protein|nr:hypothetical protein [bacterium]MBT6832222.1 hypothetical protein [bacterium]MBT6996228.1 hypothetical protein [bacterium]
MKKFRSSVARATIVLFLVGVFTVPIAAAQTYDMNDSDLVSAPKEVGDRFNVSDFNTIFNILKNLIFYSSSNVLYFDNSNTVGFGDSSPDGTLKVDIEGKVGATEYCDEDGANCTAAADLGGGGVGTFVGKTTATTDGSVSSGGFTGYAAANDMCNTEYSGSHLCSTDEIMGTIFSSDLSSFSDWTGTSWVNTGASKYALTTVHVDDCQGWEYGDTTTHRGNFWSFNTSTGGVGGVTACNLALSLACCE